jgi:hypothetical protein
MFSFEFKQVPIEGDVGSGSGPSGAAAANRLVISRPTVSTEAHLRSLLRHLMLR